MQETSFWNYKYENINYQAPFFLMNNKELSRYMLFISYCKISLSGFYV